MDLGAVAAHATEDERASYKEAVEPICKANTEANEKILKGVRQQVKQEMLKPAGAKFTKAAKALEGAYDS